MRLEELTVANFRNYEEETLRFGRFNLFLGENAQGKTNLLEAIHMLAATRSHRSASDAEMARHGASSYYIRGLLNDGYSSRRLEIAYERGGRKRVTLDGKPQTRFSNIVGLLKIVFFAPESTAAVRGSPEDRRRFLDALISQARKDYLSDLIEYRRALSQRNEALKQARDRRIALSELRVWEAPLVEAGVRLAARRLEVCKELRPLLRLQHERLAGEGEEAELIYRANASGEPLETAFAERLSAAEPNDIRRGTTSVGPHRDDLELRLNGRSARRFGSQGQQRTLTLALKLSEFEWLKAATGIAPVALLDDVVSELDRGRAARLFSVFGSLSPQVFLTATEAPDDLRARAASDVWQIRAGTAQYAEGGG